MTQRLAPCLDSSDEVDRWISDSTPSTKAETNVDGRRFRRGDSISWSFTPIGLRLVPREAVSSKSEDARNASLVIWIDSGGHEVDINTPSIAHMCATNWLHITLNDGVSIEITNLSRMMSELREVTSLLSETYPISSDRVYLASSGIGTSVALRLLLMQPDTFRGIALFNSHLPSMPNTIDNDCLQKVRALLIYTVHHAAPIREMFRFGRLLHSAGLQMTTHFSLPHRNDHGWLLVDWLANEQSEEVAWQCHW